MEENKKVELNDEELDNVSGGANLDAWFASGRSGAPICMSGHAKIVMDSYFKDGSLYVECKYCKIPKKLELFPLNDERSTTEITRGDVIPYCEVP